VASGAALGVGRGEPREEPVEDRAEAVEIREQIGVSAGRELGRRGGRVQRRRESNVPKRIDGGARGVEGPDGPLGLVVTGQGLHERARQLHRGVQRHAALDQQGLEGLTVRGGQVGASVHAPCGDQGARQ
jgi:hypothetical protein